VFFFVPLIEVLLYSLFCEIKPTSVFCKINPTKTEASGSKTLVHLVPAVGIPDRDSCWDDVGSHDLDFQAQCGDV
jgi:hypothetical protein